jgi:hypothetical protein
MKLSILDAFAPLNFFSKFCGYSMFTVSRVNYSPTFKNSDFLFQLWIFIVTCYLNSQLWSIGQIFPMHKSDIISKSLPIILCVSYVLYLITIMATVGTRKKQSALIRCICEVDEMVRRRFEHRTFTNQMLQLSELGCSFDYLRQRRLEIFKLLVMFIVISIILAHCVAVQVIYKLTTRFVSISFLYL